MNYVLLIIALLTFVLIVVSFWLNSSNTKVIYNGIKKNREISQAQQIKIENLSKDFLKAIQLIIDCQEALDKTVQELTKLVDTQNKSLHGHLTRFNLMVQSDMLSARRDELIRTKELKVALERLMGVALTSRQPASPNDVLALENINNRITELENILNEYRKGVDILMK